MAAAVSTLILSPLASQGSGAAAPTSFSSGPRTGRIAPEHHRCLSARRALRFYRAGEARSLRAMAVRPARLSWPPDRGACAYVRWLVERAKERAHAARLALEHWRHEYAWWLWLPARWKALIRCETRSTFTWNSGTYQGAFGFHRSSWDAFRLPGYPSEAYLATPREQFNVALAIHARFGFSGWGCA